MMVPKRGGKNKTWKALLSHQRDINPVISLVYFFILSPKKAKSFSRDDLMMIMMVGEKKSLVCTLQTKLIFPLRCLYHLDHRNSLPTFFWGKQSSQPSKLRLTMIVFE